MTHQEVCLLFRAWQSTRWDMEVKARILDKAMDDACAQASGWPQELFDEFDSVRLLSTIRYEELVSALRASGTARAP